VRLHVMQRTVISPSDRLSVKHVDCDKMKETSAHIAYELSIGMYVGDLEWPWTTWPWTT